MNSISPSEFCFEPQQIFPCFSTCHCWVHSHTFGTNCTNKTEGSSQAAPHPIQTYCAYRGKKAAKNLAGWRSWSLAASSKIASSTRCRWWVICTIKWPWKTEAQEAGLRYWDVAKGPEGCNPRQTCLIFSWITLLPSIFPGIQTTYPDHLLSVDWNINFLG